MTNLAVTGGTCVNSPSVLSTTVLVAIHFIININKTQLLTEVLCEVQCYSNTLEQSSIPTGCGRNTEFSGLDEPCHTIFSSRLVNLGKLSVYIPP